MLPVSALKLADLRRLLADGGLQIELIDAGLPIPGSYWGEPEAGLIGASLYVRGDTPVHSALHEASHFLCMDSARRQHLHRDAGGSDTEENAVCYLQCLLASQLPAYSQQRCFADMDSWGYTFRLGSTQAWFEGDSDDAQAWLRARSLLPG